MTLWLIILMSYTHLLKRLKITRITAISVLFNKNSFCQVTLLMKNNKESKIFKDIKNLQWKQEVTTILRG